MEVVEWRQAPLLGILQQCHLIEDQFSLLEAVLPMTTATILCMSSQSMRQGVVDLETMYLDQLVCVLLLVEIEVILDH